jgi:serine-type D-Ala-D-Ala carboxypeptidase/endopeptidase
MRRPVGPPLLLLLLLALVVPLAAVPATAQHFPPDGDLEIMLRYLVEDGETPGVVLSVLEEDRSTRAVGYGSGGPGTPRLSPRSLFEIGSLTMTLTAALLAEMVVRGDVALDDPVAIYLPDHVTVPAPGGYQITLGDLATHRSGLPAGPRGSADITVDDLYDLVVASDLERPGVRYAFSHLGYGLLGHALARATGTRYDALLQDRILDPLGMAMTGFAPDVTEAMQGATGLRSTAEDLLRFLDANAGQPATALERAIRMAHEVRVERGESDQDAGYGFSWRTYGSTQGSSLIGHGGGTDGVTAQIWFDAERGIGTVLLASTAGFRDRIARSLLLIDPRSSWEAAPVDRATLDRYAGTYRMTGRWLAIPYRGRAFIRLEDEGYLTYQTRRAVRTRLYAESDTSFYMLRAPYTVAFRTTGSAMGMLVRVDERRPNARATSWRAWKVGDDTPPSAVVAGNLPRWRTWGPLTWSLIGVLGLVAIAVIARLATSRRTGSLRGRDRAAWSRPGQYP